MKNTMRSIAYVQSVVLLAAVGLISFAASTEVSEAKPKKLSVSQSCTCGCEFQDSEGTWHWGEDVNFASSDCRQWKNKKQSCFSNGQLVSGRLTMCMPVLKDTESAVDGGNVGVFDPGADGSKDGNLTPGPYGPRTQKGGTLSTSP